MVERENHFTVFIRLPFNRGDFLDPPPVAWSAAKERELWDIISRQSKGNEIDWRSLAAQFEVTQQFLLQQTAWLYERQLSQVRAQMRRMGNRQSATPSPAAGSGTASVVGTTAAKRSTGATARASSRLSTQIPTTASPVDTSVPNTPARSRTSLPLQSHVSTTPSNNTRGHSTSSRPLSRRPSRDNESTSRTHSRRGSIQQQLSKPPGDARPIESSSSEDETVNKPSHRRPNPATTQRRASSGRKAAHARTPSLSVHQLQEAQEEDEDEDDPAFLPFVNTTSKRESSTLSNPSDPGATLRTGLPQPQHAISVSARPGLQRNPTSERVRPSPSTTALSAATPTVHTTSKSREQQVHTYTQPQARPQPVTNLTSSTSSLSSSSNNASTTPAAAIKTNHNDDTNSSSPALTRPNIPTPLSHRPSPNLPTPLSPRQQAALATAAGLSPRRRSTNPPALPQPGSGHAYIAAATATGAGGSESSPSMGSSFSDLDDASVTQSALEEALMSNMNALGSTGAVGGLGSRVSGISQALRSRYFDARGGSGGPGHNGGGGGGAPASGSERG